MYFFMKKTFNPSLAENDLASVMMKKTERTGLVSAVPMRVCTWGWKENPLHYECKSICCDSLRRGNISAHPTETLYCDCPCTSFLPGSLLKKNQMRKKANKEKTLCKNKETRGINNH